MSSGKTLKPLASIPARVFGNEAGKITESPTAKAFPACGSVWSTSTQAKPSSRFQSNHSRFASSVFPPRQVTADFRCKQPVTGTAVRSYRKCSRIVASCRMPSGFDLAVIPTNTRLPTHRTSPPSSVPGNFTWASFRKRSSAAAIEGASFRRVSVPSGQITATSSTTIAGSSTNIESGSSGSSGSDTTRAPSFASSSS